MGLCSYYKRFVKGFSQLNTPLTDLTNKGSFQWNEKVKHTFKRLEEAMSTRPILPLPDFTQPFILECDASEEGIGVVLMQDKHLITHASLKLTQVERLYSIYDKEMLVIGHTLTKFRQNLVGAKFIVRTNHNSLRYFLDQRDLNERQQKWVIKIRAHDFDIEYVKGIYNVIANALSRKPSICLLSHISANWKAYLLVEYSKNTIACKLATSTMTNTRWSMISSTTRTRYIWYLNLP